MDPDPLLLSISHLETVKIAEIILLLSLIICSALISGTEVAFFSLSQKDKNALKEESKGGESCSKTTRKTKKITSYNFNHQQLYQHSYCFIVCRLRFFCQNQRTV